MLGVCIHQHGGREVLSHQELPDPVVGPQQVRVRVRACALNFLDVWVRRGLPHLKLHYPHILGADVAGEIESVGEGVEGIEVGRRVLVAPGVSCGHCQRCLAGEDNLCRHYGLLGEHRDGGNAELLVVPVANILPYPGALPFEQAAAIPVTFQTAWQMLVQKAAVRPTETVLVLAAGSGVGSAAVQIAKMLGATVIATASSQEKLDRAKALGADFLVDHSAPRWDKAVRQIVGKDGVDVVFEHVGAATWKQSIRLAAWGGRIVTCGATSGFDAETDLRHIFFRQIAIFGSTMGSKAVLYDVIKLVGQGVLKPVVDRVLPLADVAEAHELLEERKVFGKVVLTV